MYKTKAASNVILPIEIVRLFVKNHLIKPLRMNAKPLLLPPLALKRVTSKSGKGVYASSDKLFKGAVFGRDSIEVAEDLLTIRPRLVRRIIKTLASLQGEIVDDDNEEEPGKIIHEYRTKIVDGKKLDKVSQAIFDELALRWGGTKDALAYFGSVDATPHFLRLIGKYIDRYGDNILSDKVAVRSGHKLSLRLVVENSADWMFAKLQGSRSGLLEYQSRNPQGIENQVWKDSKEFYVHESGEYVNHNAPVASIEVQVLAYDGLLAAARHLPNKADRLLQAAADIRDKTIELLWQPDQQYFALGTDVSEEGELRIINTLTANPAAMLDSGFFDELPHEDRQRYVTAIVRKIMGREFLTDAGIRSRALKDAHLVPFWDYHGSYTTWPKETYDIAKGLRRHGFPQLARELENRLLNVVIRSGNYPEFTYVDDWGRVLNVSPALHEHGNFTVVDSTNAPERIQAWTVSAVLAIANDRMNAKLKPMKRFKQERWQFELEQHLLSHIPRVKRLFNPVALRAKYPSYEYKLVKNNSKGSSNFLHNKIG